MTNVLGDTAPAENERTSSGVLPSPLHSTFRPVENSDVVYPAFGRHSSGIHFCERQTLISRHRC